METKADITKQVSLFGISVFSISKSKILPGEEIRQSYESTSNILFRIACNQCEEDLQDHHLQGI